MILPLVLLIIIRKSRTWSKILLVVLTEFRCIKEARISHADEWVVLEHWVEIKRLGRIRPLECLSLELLLKLGTEDSIEIFKVRSIIVCSMTEINVIIWELSIIWSVSIILLHVLLAVVHRINLVTQVDS